MVLEDKVKGKVKVKGKDKESEEIKQNISEAILTKVKALYHSRSQSVRNVGDVILGYVWMDLVLAISVEK